METKITTKNFSFCRIILRLNLGAEGKVAGIAEARYDVAFGCKLVVDSAAPNKGFGYFPPQVFNAYGAGNGRNDVNGFGLAFFFQLLNCFYRRIAYGSIRIG